MKFAKLLLIALCTFAQPIGAQQLIYNPLTQVLDANGDPYSGAKLYVFDAGTTTNRTTYSDKALTTPNANPLVADSAGRFGPLYIAASATDYKLRVDTSADVVVYTQDNIPISSFDQATIGLTLYPQTTAESSASVTPTNYHHPPLYLLRYGCAGDGTTDDATCLQAGLDVANQSGLPLVIPYTSTYYKFDTALTLASATNPIKIVGEGMPELRYEGSSANYAVQVTDTNGNDFEIDGVVINADQNAAMALRVDNPSASMADANIGKAIFRNSMFKDGWLAVGNTYASAGIAVAGGFSEMVVENVVIRNMDRATGAGVSGTRGSAGIIAAFDDINAYVRKLTINGGEVDTVTNNETTGNAADSDVDCIIYTAPGADDNGGHHLPASATISGTRFKDCKGRVVKTQVDGFTILRDLTVENGLEEHINNAVDFNLQRGPGIIDGVVYYANETSGGTTTWGTSHTIVAWGADQLATTTPNGDGGLTVKDVTIYNAIAAGVDDLPHFAIVTNDDVTKDIISVRIKDSSVIGGRVTQWFRTTSALTADTEITLSGLEGDTTSALLFFNAEIDASVRITAYNNRNQGTITTPVLVSLASGVEPTLNSFGNTGFVTTFNSQADGSNDITSEVFRPEVLGGDSTTSHQLVLAQTVTLADDATHNFTATGHYGIGFITNNFSDSTQAIFAFDTNDITEIYQAGATSASISVGTAQTNPDVDVDLNIWKSADTVLSIKNRLGTSRVFHLFVFGGNF